MECGRIVLEKWKAQLTVATLESEPYAESKVILVRGGTPYLMRII
jgi:hypothetical protein